MSSAQKTTNETTSAKTGRKRATKSQIKSWDEFLYSYAKEYHPVSVRQLYYAATVAELDGIDKTEQSYRKIQKRVLNLRRSGMMPYRWVVDNSRSVWSMTTYDGLSNAAASFADDYRLDFWHDRSDRVEVYIEKDALAGTILPITRKYRVDLFPARGFASEGYVESAVRSAVSMGKSKLIAYSLFDFDRAGQDAQFDLGAKLRRLGHDQGLIVEYHPIGLTHQMVMDYNLSTRPPKRESPADKKWAHSIACELDAMPPQALRNLVGDALSRHLSLDDIAMFEGLEAVHKSQIRMAVHDLVI